MNIPGLQKNVVLAPFTTYKIGGEADFFVEVKNEGDLINAISEARKNNVPYFLLGTGANILIKDAGFRGLVIRNLYSDFKLDGDKLWAASGAVIADLINECKNHGLSGLEHFVGIPSSVGGAIWQNLHFLSPDRQGTTFIAEVVESARILDENLNKKTVDKDFFKFGYDDSILHHKNIVVLDVTFKLRPKPEEEIEKQMTENMAWRIAKQPQLDEFPSCGSVFKKIEGVGAGRLIDQAGLKGKQIGGIKISEKHANYMVNVGGGKATDVLALIDLAQKEVKQKTGYELEPEIRILGE